MADIRFYISGHGLGHASRSCQVVNRLRQMAPQVTVEVVTTAHPWFLAGQLSEGVPVRSLSLDVGVLQRDSLVMLEETTLAHCRAILPEIEHRAMSEAESLRRNRVKLVVSDIPAAAFTAAASAGIPGVGMANFSWDWIYQHFNERLDLFGDVVAAFREQYAKADLLLRLPFHGPTDAFPHVEDIPMVARLAQQGRSDVCQALDLPTDRRLALLSFGGFGLSEMDLGPLADYPEWIILGEMPLEGSPPNYRIVAPGAVPYPDLVAAVDVVVTKPGYGIVSESIANNTAVIYTHRGDFPEQPILEEGLRTYSRSMEITNEDLRCGAWGPALSDVLSLPTPQRKMPANGDRVVARRLLEILHRPETLHRRL